MECFLELLNPRRGLGRPYTVGDPGGVVGRGSVRGVKHCEPRADPLWARHGVVFYTLVKTPIRWRKNAVILTDVAKNETAP